jgi:hypothetical protein
VNFHVDIISAAAKKKDRMNTLKQIKHSGFLCAVASKSNRRKILVITRYTFLSWETSLEVKFW